jgi:hypothetical protein
MKLASFLKRMVYYTFAVPTIFILIAFLVLLFGDFLEEDC